MCLIFFFSYKLVVISSSCFCLDQLSSWLCNASSIRQNRYSILVKTKVNIRKQKNKKQKKKKKEKRKRKRKEKKLIKKKESGIVTWYTHINRLKGRRSKCPDTIFGTSKIFSLSIHNTHYVNSSDKKYYQTRYYARNKTNSIDSNYS